jgi:CENP-B N-terminal DNA-binding domain
LTVLWVAKAMPTKRKKYSLKMKLEIIRLYKKGFAGRGLQTIAKIYEICVDTLQGWIKKKEELVASLINGEDESQKARCSSGGGQGPKFADLEDLLHLWILDHTTKGLTM